MGVSINGVPNSWMVYKRESQSKWMIWGYPRLWKPLYMFNVTRDMFEAIKNRDELSLLQDHTNSRYTSRAAQPVYANWQQRCGKRQLICLLS